MKTSLKILAFLFLIFINSCGSKDNDDEILAPEEEENKVTITAENINLKDAQIGTIAIENFTLNQQTYNATFGNEAIVLGKTDDTKLSFVVPANIATGTYSLQLDIASNSVDFIVTTTTLVDTPENVILNFVGDYETDIDETIALFTQGNVPPQLLSLKDDMNNAIAEINSLTDNNKIIAAKFIENNSDNLNLLESELLQQDLIFIDKSQNKKCDTPKCYLIYGTKVLAAAALVDIGGTVAIIGAAIIGIDAIISLMRGKQSVLISKVKKVVSEAFNIAYFAQNFLAETTFNAIDNFIANFKGSNTKTNKIDNKTSISFRIKPSYRTLNASDASSSDEIASNFVAAYISFNQFWNNNFANNLGAFPNFNTKEEQKEAEDLSQFSLEITQNADKVSASDIGGTTEAFSTTFTNNTDVEQDFSLDIIFTDNDVVAKTNVSFTIGFDEIFIEKVSGDTQKGIKNEVLENPIVVKVVDAEGNAMIDVDVEFKITQGEGSVSASSVKTNSNGVAQVNWTLGDNLDSQALEVSVKNSANENISTSPLTFTAISEELELFLEIVSGNNQTGEDNKQLENPLVVKVADDKGNGIENINVEFNITSGNGSISASSVTTNSNGFAQINWTLGDDNNQSVEAIVKKADGTNIEGSPVLFNATINNPIFGNWEAISYDGKNIGEATQDGYNEKCNVYLYTYSINSSSLIINENSINFNINQTTSNVSYSSTNGDIDCNSIVISPETDSENTSFEFEDFIKQGSASIYEKITTFSDGQVNTLIIQLINNNQISFTNKHKDTDGITRIAYSILYNRK